MSPVTDLPVDAGFVEVADRCFVARHAWLDVNVSVVAGDRGLLVVDTHGSEDAARTVLENVRRLGRGEVVAVVNTHDHYDHTFGNTLFRAARADLPIHAHEAAAERIPTVDHVFSSVRVIDLGDRLVELIHPGRGHTGGDAVARVPDAGVIFAGDLVEESATRPAVPGFGPDCYPLEWPATLDLVIGMLAEDTVVVPGHGRPVDADFVRSQRGEIGMVAEAIRDLAGRGVAPAGMATAAEWPYPVEELADAFARGYAQLPRPGRALPLV